MKKAREFDNILDECLERVLVKGETIDQCLAEYPEYAAELEPLLQTALVSKEALAIKPRPEFRERAGYQFQAALREMESRKSRGFFGWQPRWATAVVVVIALLLAGSGTVAAAGNSQPDEPLYPVKLATEVVRLTLTPSALGKAELYVKLADKRVAEIIKMADKGKAKQVERTAQRLNTHLIAMASLAVPGGEEFVEREVATFEAEPSQMAVEEAPQAQVEEAPAPALAPALAPAPVPAPASEPVPAPAIRIPGPPEGVPGKGVGIGGGRDDKGNKQDKLKRLLYQRAAENSMALQQILDRVPESVKPALQEAIRVAGAGYEQALGHLD